MIAMRVEAARFASPTIRSAMLAYRVNRAFLRIRGGFSKWLSRCLA